MISDTYIVMDGLLLLSERQMARKIAEFPAVAWGSRVDGRRILSGLLYVIRNGFGGKHDNRLDPHKTLNNRFIRWSRFGGFRGIIAGRAGEWPNPERHHVDATYLKARLTAASLLEKVWSRSFWDHRKAG